MVVDRSDAEIDRTLVEAASVVAGTSERMGRDLAIRPSGLRRLLHRTEEQCSIGILHYALDANGWKGVDDDVRQAIVNAYLRQLAHNHFVIDEMKSVLDCLKGLDCLVFKGLAMASVYYDDLGIRPTADIDILIHRHNVYDAVKLLGELGYSVKPDFEEKVALYCHGTLERPDSPGVPVEAHWTLGRDFPSNPDDSQLWLDAVEAKTEGVCYRTLSTGNHLLQAALHLTHHAVFGGFPSLLWLTDVALLSRRADFDWNELAERAVKQGFSRAVYISLALAERVLGGRFPKQVEEALRKESGSVPYIVHRGLIDKIAVGGINSLARTALAASFQGSAGMRTRYLARHWVKPALKFCGLRKS